jgi:hypothetical protein
MKSPLISALLFAFALPFGLAAHAQQAGPVPTQVLVNVDAKATPPASASALTVSVNDKKEPLTAWGPVTPANAQVVLLIDDGLSPTTIGKELDNLRSFVRSLPAGVQITVGYMHNNKVSAFPLTADHELAASKLHPPQGMAGLDSNPYVSISFLVKNWAGLAAPPPSTTPATSSPGKARFILMLTDGVDPHYNNDVGIQQESPFVDAAIEDAQRAGVSINEIYISNGGGATGGTYLSRITELTGGTNYWEGTTGTAHSRNPVSTAPFLQQFQRSIAQTYIATFNAPAINNPQHDLVRVKFTAAKTKLRAPEQVRPGNVE